MEIQVIYSCESSEVSGQMRVLNRQIYNLHVEILYIGELVSDPDSMGCCLNGLAHTFGFVDIYISVVEPEFFCEGAEYGCFEDECLVLRESVPRDS